MVEHGDSVARTDRVDAIPGHPGIETTQRYAKLSDEAVMREAERLDGKREAQA
jgi:hypothetical protein